jgi:hypothetical protein
MLIVLAAVASVYYAIDPTSLARFATHALGYQTGLGVVNKHVSFLDKLHLLSIVSSLTTKGLPFLFGLDVIISHAVLAIYLIWAMRNKKELSPACWIVLTVGVVNILSAIVLFPAQNNYVIFIAVFIPTALIAVGGWTPPFVRLGILLLFLNVVVVPTFNSAFDLLCRFEARSSYIAASQQPAYLISRLHSADDLVLFNAVNYDMYKPAFKNLVTTYYMGDGIPPIGVAAVANCYYGFNGARGAIRPLPSKINPEAFHLIQAAPSHTWLTIFGRRISNMQRGYGCDLYVKN